MPHSSTEKVLFLFPSNHPVAMEEGHPSQGIEDESTGLCHEAALPRRGITVCAWAVVGKIVVIVKNDRFP